MALCRLRKWERWKITSKKSIKLEKSQGRSGKNQQEVLLKCGTLREDLGNKYPEITRASIST